MWNKAIRELRKVDKQTTPRSKLQYLLNSIVVFNQSFSLFTSASENNEACADDLVVIFPYLLLKAKINRLYQNIKFIKIFEYKELGCGEKAYVLNNLEISSKIIIKVYNEE